MKSSFLLKSPKNRFSVSNKRSVIKLTGAFYAGNFREWSQSSLVIIPGNPHSHPFPTFSAGRIQWSEGAGSLGCPTRVARSWNSRVTRKQPTKNWFLVCLFVCYCSLVSLVSLFVCLSVCLFVCLNVCLIVCLFVCFQVRKWFNSNEHRIKTHVGFYQQN